MSCSIVLLVVGSTIKNQKYIRKFKTVRNNRRHRGISVPKRVFPYNTLLIFLKISPETPFLFWSHGFNNNKSKLHLNGTLNLYLGSNFFISGVRLDHLRIYSFTYSKVRYCYIPVFKETFKPAALYILLSNFQPQNSWGKFNFDFMKLTHVIFTYFVCNINSLIL